MSIQEQMDIMRLQLRVAELESNYSDLIYRVEALEDKLEGKSSKTLKLPEKRKSA